MQPPARPYILKGSGIRAHVANAAAEAPHPAIPGPKEMVNLKEPEAFGGEPSAEIVARANELYWHSDESVNALARELDLSKGALYEAIVPLPAGLPCPARDCELSYPNRTARDRGFVSCTMCGFEDEEDRVRIRLEIEAEGDASEPAAPQVAPNPAPHGAVPLLPDPPPSRKLETLLATSALLGLAAGLILGGLIRRR